VCSNRFFSIAYEEYRSVGAVRFIVSILMSGADGSPPHGWRRVGRDLLVDGLQPHDPERVGNYRLVARLGAGGMGRVFLGESPAGRKVAVKLVHPEHAMSAEFRARFAREIQAARQVSGFYTAPVVDADPDAEPPWLVTAYIPGPTLQEEVETHGPLPPEQVRRLGAQVAEGLAAIHACGLVHRDLKPGNVILAEDGPRIIDFGIAILGQAPKLTASGMALGTFAYMSPEQARGTTVGPATDVFALGGMLAFAATGLPPFGGDPPDLDGVADEQFRQLIIACLARSAADRPALADILGVLSGGHTLPVRSPGETDATGPEPWWSAWPQTQSTDAEPEPPAEAWPQPPAGPLPPTLPGPEPPTEGSRLSRRTLLGLGTVVAGAAIASALVLTDHHPPAAQASGGHPAGRGGTKPFTISSGPAVLLDASSGGVYSVAFSPDGSRLASGNIDGTVKLWDVGTRTRTASLTHADTDRSNPSATVGGTKSWSVYAVAFSPDSSILASGNGDGTIGLWDVATQQGTATLPDINTEDWNSFASCVAFSPNGSVLAASYDAPAVTLWNVSARSPMTTLAADTGWWVYAVAFSPDGFILASGNGDNDSNAGSNDGAVQLWDVASRTRTATLTSTNCGAGSLAFSPDGATLANVNGDRTITLWHVAARTSAATLTSAGRGAKCVAFSPDGTILASGNDDGTITLWDVAARTRAATLQTGTGAAVRSVAFSPDGTVLAGGGARLMVWTIRRT
jgi:serine/threonine protein kinase